MPPIPEGRIRAAGDELTHEFSPDDFYLQKVKPWGCISIPV